MGEPYQHALTLQRLGSYISNDGKQVFYTPEAFSNTETWTNIPVIFAEAVAGMPIKHPDMGLVSTRSPLPDGFRYVGTINTVNIAPTGTPRMDGVITFTDDHAEQLAKLGKLAPSTGFYSDISPENGKNSWKIIGNVQPNHLLVFEEGACRNCYSNDNGAMFLNVKQETDIMEPETADTESKGWLKAIYEKLCNTKPDATEHVSKPEEKMENTINPEISALTAQIETLKAANVAISAEHEALKAATIKAQRDSEWTALKNTLPPAWVDAEHEAETRELAETSPLGFALKLTAFNTKIGNVKSAEGSCACSASEKEVMLANVKQQEEKIGYRPLEE